MELESDARWGPLQTTNQHFLCFTGMKCTKFTIQSRLFYFYLPTKIFVNEENMYRTSSKILIKYSYLAAVPFARNLCNNMTVCPIIRFSLSLQPNYMTVCQWSPSKVLFCYFTRILIMKLVTYLESGMVYDHLQCHHILTFAENSTDQVSPLNTAPVAPVLLSSSLPPSFDSTIFLSLESNCKRLDLGLQVNLAKLEHPVERQTHLPKQKK